VTEPLPLPAGFSVGHWTDSGARTGCTVVIPPAGARGAAEVRGGGTATREVEALSPLANAEGPGAVLFTGGSAFGLAAADGVVRWLEERRLGRPTPAGVVPLVPTAVVYDLVEGEPGPRPGPDEGYAACETARPGVPARGPIGAGAGAAVGKVLGRPAATRGGIGYAASELASGETLAAIAVVNSFGDVVGEDGRVLGGPRAEGGELLRSDDLIPTLIEPPVRVAPPGQSTTLVCLCTDAALDKRGCGIVARVASAGIARAVRPAFTPLDGDVLFCLASGPQPAPPPGLAASWALTALGTAAAVVTAGAIRDAVAAERTD
jgi:L-aminopeptidase/D-esterase-like protein